MGKKDDGECFPWKMKEQMLWTWINWLQQDYLTEVWDRGGRRSGFCRKTKIDCLLNREHERESCSSSTLIDVYALEDDVVPKLSFDGRV